MIRTVCLTLTVATLVVASPARAQAPMGVEPGQRVRVTHVLNARTVGVVQSVDADTVFVLDERGARHPIGTDGIYRLELHQGIGRRFGRDFLITTAASAAVFGVLSAVTYEPQPCGWVCIGPNSGGEAFMWGAVAGGILGIPVGVVVGLVARHDRWTDIDRPYTSRRATVRLQPTPEGRVGLVGSIPTRW